jgi:hypothetical protein
MKSFKEFLKEYTEAELDASWDKSPFLSPETASDARYNYNKKMISKAKNIADIPAEQYATTTVRGGNRVQPISPVPPNPDDAIYSKDVTQSSSRMYDHDSHDLKDPLYHAATKSKVTEVQQQQAEKGKTPQQRQLEQDAMNPSGAQTPKPWSGMYQQLLTKRERDVSARVN